MEEVVKVWEKQKQAAIPYIPFALLASSYPPSFASPSGNLNPPATPVFSIFLPFTSHTKHYHLLFSLLFSFFLTFSPLSLSPSVKTWSKKNIFYSLSYFYLLSLHFLSLYIFSFFLFSSRLKQRILEKRLINFQKDTATLYILTIFYTIQSNYTKTSYRNVTLRPTSFQTCKLCENYVVSR